MIKGQKITQNKKDNLIHSFCNALTSYLLLE